MPGPRRTRERRLTAQLPIMDYPETAGRIRAWAEVRDMELSALLREIVAAGLERLEPTWIKANGGELDVTFLEQHIANSPKLRGGTHAEPDA